MICEQVNKYRMEIAKNLLEKCCVEIKHKKLIGVIFKMKKKILFNEKRPHESAIKHVSGYAFYT